MFPKPMIRPASALPLLALLWSAPLAAQAARDFQLPPAATPTPDSRVQGPVDTDAPVPLRPRAIATPRPTPTATASAPPEIVLPTPAQTQPTAAARVRAAPATGAARAVSREPAPAAAASRPVPLPAAQSSAPLPLPSAPAITQAPVAAVPFDKPVEAPLPWLWMAFGGLVLLLAAAALVLRRHRSRSAAPPPIVVPLVPSAASGEALAIAVEAVRMDRSVLNATVGYRVTLRNKTAQALTGLAVEADLVSANRERPAEQQLASPHQALTPRHAAERLAPGQSLRFEGQVRLPLSEASTIWQGRVGLLVPLLRVRATATDVAAIATTLVIGRSEGQASRPQPFRLDEPPRSYAPLAQRVLDAVPAGA